MALVAATGEGASTEKHWRLQTDKGAVHVLRPPKYNATTAGIVLYVHGLFNDVDSAWDEHKLRNQLVEANRNALFIAPDAPKAAEDNVKWTSLPDLLALVEKTVPLPKGPIIAVGHSGAYRTIVTWLAHPRLQHVILLDGLYGNEEDYAKWTAEAEHKFAMTVLTTTKWSTPFLARFPDAELLPRIPTWTFTEAQKAARVVSMPSQFGHMELVTEGKALPVMLRVTALPRRIEWGKK